MDFIPLKSSAAVAARPTEKQFAHRIALVNPLGDYGIDSYTYELAEGLTANGASVDVFTSGTSVLQAVSLPRHHQLYPVLGSLLITSREKLHRDKRVSVVSQEQVAQWSSESRSKANNVKDLIPPIVRRVIRRLMLSVELVTYLKSRKYDIVWTQWPEMGEYGPSFWMMCKLAGLRLVHTVHNVLPHEETDKSARSCRLVYERCDRLIVHSNYSFRQLVKLYPDARRKTLVSPHGAYSIFQRIPETRARVRQELRIAPHQVAWLFFGSIRPYKNVDAVLHALRELAAYDPVLIIAGSESGYDDLVPGQLLGRTARLAEQLGVADRVRLLPERPDFIRTAELFEAADIVPLPYLKSYGSGVLLLAITFGNYIVASCTGGMEEYLAHYPRHTLLGDVTATEVARGMRAMMDAAANALRPADPPAEFDWTRIAAVLLEQLKNTVA